MGHPDGQVGRRVGRHRVELVVAEVRIIDPDEAEAAPSHLDLAVTVAEIGPAALGERGAKLIAIGIAVSTLGFLSQSMLTAPRVYYAMATDGVFFRAVARVHPVTRVPYIAIALQGLVAIVITLSGKYEQILNYVVATDFIFFGLTGAALFVFRRREVTQEFRTPGHPVTTALFTVACWTVVVATVVRSPMQSAIGLAIIAAGGIAYAVWRYAAGGAMIDTS